MGPDYPEAVRRIREIKREAEEADYKIKPAIRPNIHVRQIPGQQFQQSGKPAAWTVDPKTCWGHLLDRLLNMVIINRTAGVLSTPSFVVQGFRLQAMAIPL